jgi:hypothetical protein
VSATTPSDGSARAAPPDVAEAQRIAAIENPVIRNLEITECYAQLAAAMATRAPACSNWCTYATWASRQAGATIRGEDLVVELERELDRDAELAHPLASVWRWLIRRGLFRLRRRILEEPPLPALFVRGGPRPGGLAPPETASRFGWSLAASPA